MSEPVITWATAVAENKTSGRAIVFRYAKDFRSDFYRSSLPDRVIVVWNYESDSGMPEQTEIAKMERLENRLAPLLEKSGIGVLVLVSTGENLREWIFYVTCEHALFAIINKALSDKPPFPIEIHAGPDADWSSYDLFRSGLAE